MTDAAGLKSASSSSNILDLVNRTVELPTIPTVLVKLNEVISNPNANAADVATVISTDPSVSANVLRIVNSAYYGLQVRVSSVSLAVSIMGFHMTRKVALRAAIFSVFAKRKDKLTRHFDPEKFWRHSIFTGVAARALASHSRELDGVHPEDVYVCGLLHDIGKIIMIENQPGPYAAILEEAARSGAHSLQAEQEALGFSHADVGSVLAIKWFLPEDLTIAIRYHHAPEKDPFHRSLSSVIHLADAITWQAGHPSTQETGAPVLREEAYETAGIARERIDSLIKDIHKDFAAASEPW